VTTPRGQGAVEVVSSVNSARSTGLAKNRYPAPAIHPLPVRSLPGTGGRAVLVDRNRFSQETAWMYRIVKIISLW